MGENAPVVCYEVDPRAPMQCTHGGVREPVEPYPQARRVRADYVAFLVVKGEIHLTDCMPGGEEQVTVRPGEIHIIAPGLYQSSTAPFAPGIRFLWFHFQFPGAPRLHTRGSALRAVQRLHRPAEQIVPQALWLVPRHLQLGDGLDAFIALHTALFDNIRLFGFEDDGSRYVCGHMVHALHRAFTRQLLDAGGPGRATPEAAHAARAQNFVRLHYEKPISLSEVAEAVGLHPSYLSRCFRRVTGQTVVEFILRTRVSAAKALLAEGRAAQTVKQVAFSTGFSSTAYFCRIFRRFERQTAQEYQARRAAHSKK